MAKEMRRWPMLEGGGLAPREPRRLEIPTMADTGEVDLRGFFRTISRHKLTLVLMIATTLGGGLYWVTHATPRYSADALIVIESRPSSIVKVDQAVQDVSGDLAMVNTEVAVLQSRGLATRVIDDLGLADDPEFAPRVLRGGLIERLKPAALLAFVLDAWLKLQALVGNAIGGNASAGLNKLEASEEPAASEAEQARARAALLDRFLSDLRVEPEDANSRLVHIAFTSIDPAKAARITNKVVETYIASQLETKTEGARRAANWLQARLTELGGTVQSLEQSLQRQRTDSGLAENDGTNIASQRLAQLNMQLVAAQANSASTLARYQQVRAILESGGNVEALPSVIGSTTIQALRARRSALESQLSQLTTSLGDRHPQVISMRADLSEVERELGREINTVLLGLQNEVDAANRHEAVLRQELADAAAEMVRLNKAEASVGQARQRLQANRDLYQNLLKRYTEAVALRDNQQPDARVISAAQIPLLPSYPNVLKVMALSLIGGISLAVLVVIVSERLRQKLSTVEDVEHHVGVQVIGAVPDFPRLRRLTSAPGDYMQREPLSEFGTAFQRIRALLALGNNRKMPEVVLVTSPAAGEGKTTVAVCLAVASVSSGQRVLLVDCDFGRPQIHRMASFKNDKGLSDLLKGTATVEEAVTQATDYDFSILTAGRSQDGAIDVLNSGRMEELLGRLRRTYDLIIINSTSVIEASNALILAGLADRTILVSRREWTTRRNAIYAANQLYLYGADIAGVVFNRSGATGNPLA